MLINWKRYLKKALYFHRISWHWLLGHRVRAHEYAVDYDTVSATYNRTWEARMGKHTQSMLDRVIAQPGSRILDLACGTGFVLECQAKKLSPAEMIGIDCSKGMLELARERLSEKCREWSGRFILSHGDMLEEIRKLPDAHFDVVTCCWAMSYSRPDALMREISRVLKSGGMAGIVDNTRQTLPGVEQAVIELMQEAPLDFRTVNDIRFRLPAGSTSLKRLFGKNGLVCCEHWDGEETFEFRNGTEAVVWLFECGALAGNFRLFGRTDMSNRLAQVFDRKGLRSTVHRFCAVVGKKC
ncbi:MAG: methyltransferase domain-containing protein [Candidatus Wallbacteria bacterium]|nr:methyltransferase domain-containing protein [Candidatus Wallbacteria bacterium]